MTEPTEAEVAMRLADALEWIGTSLQQLVDIQMHVLVEANGDSAELLDYAHRVRGVFTSDMGPEEFETLRNDMIGYNADAAKE